MVLYKWVDSYKRFHKRNEKILVVTLAITLIIILLQFLYPTDKLLPFSSINGLNFSGWSKADTVQALNNDYEQNNTMALYFGQSEQPYLTPKPSEFGVTIENNERLSSIVYPWYMRLIPTSILWASAFVDTGEPIYRVDKIVMKQYISKTFGDNCKIEPKNANIVVKEGDLALQEAVVGGTCDINELNSYIDNLDIGTVSRIFLPVVAELPQVMNDEAVGQQDKINQKLSSGIDLKVTEEKVHVSKSDVISWLDFSVKGGKLDYSFNAERAKGFLDNLFEQKVKIDPTVTEITTNDFIDTSKKSGSDGQALDINKTLDNIKAYIEGQVSNIDVATAVVPSPVKYIHNYSTTNTGMEALIKDFASSHAGTYGVALIELSGKQRSALYNSSEQYTAASMYKLFVAYSTLLRIESSEWHWDDANIVGDKNLSKCFDDMIVVSDNDCARALMSKASNSAVTNEAVAIGCSHTTFRTSDYRTTASDVALFLVKLQTGTILKDQSSRDTLINAMKRSAFRNGIPSGTNNIVADKVGFLEDLLHDASIVYAPTGTYVLVILTDSSSWANIAELTRQLDSLIAK